MTWARIAFSFSLSAFSNAGSAGRASGPTWASADAAARRRSGSLSASTLASAGTASAAFSPSRPSALAASSRAPLGASASVMTSARAGGMRPSALSMRARAMAALPRENRSPFLSSTASIRLGIAGWASRPMRPSTWADLSRTSIAESFTAAVNAGTAARMSLRTRAISPSASAAASRTSGDLSSRSAVQRPSKVVVGLTLSSRAALAVRPSHWAAEARTRSLGSSLSVLSTSDRTPGTRGLFRRRMSRILRRFSTFSSASFSSAGLAARSVRSMSSHSDVLRLKRTGSSSSERAGRGRAVIKARPARIGSSRGRAIGETPQRWRAVRGLCPLRILVRGPAGKQSHRSLSGSPLPRFGGEGRKRRLRWSEEELHLHRRAVVEDAALVVAVGPLRGQVEVHVVHRLGDLQEPEKVVAAAHLQPVEQDQVHVEAELVQVAEGRVVEVGADRLEVVAALQVVIGLADGDAPRPLAQDREHQARVAGDVPLEAQLRGDQAVLGPHRVGGPPQRVGELVDVAHRQVVVVGDDRHALVHPEVPHARDQLGAEERAAPAAVVDFAADHVAPQPGADRVGLQP